jgi:hypothetical protein
LPVVHAGPASTEQTSEGGTLLMYRPPIDAVKSQLLSDGKLMVQVEGKMRLALACILFTGQFGGGRESGHNMFRQMFLTRGTALCAPKFADEETVSCEHLAFPCI